MVKIRIIRTTTIFGKKVSKLIIKSGTSNSIRDIPYETVEKIKGGLISIKEIIEKLSDDDIKKLHTKKFMSLPFNR